jgi:hypothetical protein
VNVATKFLSKDKYIGPLVSNQHGCMLDFGPSEFDRSIHGDQLALALHKIKWQGVETGAI